MFERILIITEKHAAPITQRDGGARLVASLLATFEGTANVLQLGHGGDTGEKGKEYPHGHPNRFTRRLLNAQWVGDTVAKAAKGHTHLLFVHVSLLFGLDPVSIGNARICLFPMLLGSAYRKSGEQVPEAYIEAEKKALSCAHQILTPSHLERQMLTADYGVKPDRIRVIPRGVTVDPAHARARTEEGALRICSVGSIKSQKNPLGLLEAFADIRQSRPDAKLCLIGAVQDVASQRQLTAGIQSLALEAHVTQLGYVPPEELPGALQEQHIHLSASRCETFGRVIFETLALGIPNLTPADDVAANEYLSGKPYHTTYASAQEAGLRLAGLLEDYEARSSAALEVGKLFCDLRLRKLLKSAVLGHRALLVSDFDGTIFHKTSPALTERSVRHAAGFEKLIVCSARPIDDLRRSLRAIGLKADWLIGLSGSETESWEGDTRISEPLSEDDIATMVAENPLASPVQAGGKIHQMRLTEKPNLSIGHRAERYDGNWYLIRRSSSKLQAIVNLLDHIGWSGQVEAQGDAPSDFEYLSYFDGQLIGDSHPHPFLRKK